MGLHIHSLTKIPRDLDKDWFLYLLEYGPEEPFTKAMKACFDEMAHWASLGNSVVVKGTSPVHFSDEVFSWHRIAGLDGDEVLPAIMISTINPCVFNEFGERQAARPYKESDQLILVPLRDFVDNADQVYSFVRKLLKELASGSRLTQLSIAKGRQKSVGKRIVNAVQLKPSLSGVGIDLKALFGK